MSWALASWLFWAVWIVAGVAFELLGVFREKQLGVLPLTRIVRDRLARHFWPLKIALTAFLAWLVLHFLVPLYG